MSNNFLFSTQRLNEDICNLSTLCSEKNINDVNKIDKCEILNALKVWQETGNLPEDEIVSHVVKACSEVNPAICFDGNLFDLLFAPITDSGFERETS